jgi:gluconolactonase
VALDVLHHEGISLSDRTQHSRRAGGPSLKGAVMTWQIEKVAGPYPGEAHGPVWDGEALLFSLVTQNQILRYHPGTGSVVEYRKYTCGTRGMAFDTENRLFGCQSSARRIARFNADGTSSMLADRIDGRLHNQPYDLVIDRLGRIWFTDPEPAVRVMEPPVDHASVLRLERTVEMVWLIRRMTADTLYPTGIALSPDQRSLYVAENAPDRAKDSEIREYPLLKNDSLGAHKVLQSFPGAGGVKSMCIDSDGNLVICRGGSVRDKLGEIAVLSPAGEIVEQHPFSPGEPTNCAFGGEDLTTLYVTSSNGCLYQARNSRWGGHHAH